MSEREKVRSKFQLDIKGLCANLATELIDPSYIPSAVVEQFELDVKRMFIKRDKALTELEVVKVKRVHLRTVAKWLRDAIRGYKHTDKEATQVLGRKPLCFGTWNPDKHCNQYDYHKDGLCPACQAISPLIEDDCS